MRRRAKAVCAITASLVLSIVGWGIGFAGPGSAQAQAACPNEEARAQQSAQRLPHCRAYEQVSPADKAGGQVAFPIGRGNSLGAQAMLHAVSADGNTATFWSYGSFADAKIGLPAQYRSRRGASGWDTRMWTPTPASAHPWLSGATSFFVAATEDLSTAFIESADRFDPQDVDSTDVGFGEGMDVFRLSEGDLPARVSRWNDDAPDANPAWAVMQGHSADGRVVAFTTPEALLAPAVEGSEDPQSEGQLYASVDGVTELVSVDGNGALLSACGAALGMGGRYSTKQGAISRDGSRLFFSVPSTASSGGLGPCNQPRRIFVREGGETVAVSASQRPGGDGPTRPATFEGATPDGGTVFFSSEEALTAEATSGSSGHVYAFDVASGHLRLVADHSATVVGFSDDGRRVYAYSGNATEGPAALYEDGEEIPVASLLGGTTPDFYPQGTFPGTNESPIRVTPDGRFMFFPSTANLTGFDSHGTMQFYRFDAVTRETLCVTCNTMGQKPVGDATGGGDVSKAALSAYPKIANMSADGRRIFFDSNDRLVPADQTARTDVYEWHDGQVRLLSDGTSAKPSVLFGVGGEGRDVFFGTTSALSPADTDGGDYDIYDAREGGGFLVPIAAPGCSGEACQGEPTPAPAASRAASLSAPALGSARKKAKARCAKATPKQRKGQKGQKALRRPGKAKARCRATTTNRRQGK